MEPSPPADPRLEAVEVGHRDDDSAVAAERLDRAAQPQFGVVEMLEHVPEDDDVRALGRRAQRLDRRSQDLQPRVALCRVGLDPDDAAVAFGEQADEPAVARSDLDHSRPGRDRAERTKDCNLPEPPQRLEQQIDGNGRWCVGAAAIEARRINSRAPDSHRRAARPAAV